MKTDNSFIKSFITNRDKIGEGIYLLYFALMVGARAAGLYEGMTLYNISLVIGMLLFACKMIVTKHSAKEYLIAGAFMLLAAIVYMHTGEKGLLVCFTMMLGMKCVSVQKVIKTGAFVAGIIIMCKIFLGVFGLVHEIYYPQERDGVGLMFRHALGYAHPNTLHMNVLMLSMMVMYLITTWLMSVRGKAGNNKLLLKIIVSNDSVIMLTASLLVLCFNIYIFQYSGSRTGLLACIAYLIVNMWLYFRTRIGLIEKIISFAAFPATSFIAIVLPFLLKGKLFDFVNMTIFTTRFSIAKYFWEHNSISLFGIRLNNPNEAMATYGIDMAQLYLFLQLGLVAFIVIAALTTWFVCQAIKKERRAELAVLMGMLFLGIWEPLLYNLGFKNFVYVFMGAMLYERVNKAFEEVSMKSIEGGLMASSTYKTDNTTKITVIDIKKIGIYALISIVTGVIASMIYIAATNSPSALYGDREKNESGKSLGMEAVYLDQEEIDLLKDNGDIILGYTDAQTPMYKYDAVIAKMEYQKRILSIGVWSGMLFMALCLGYNVCPFSQREVKDKEY